MIVYVADGASLENYRPTDERSCHGSHIMELAASKLRMSPLRRRSMIASLPDLLGTSVMGFGGVVILTASGRHRIISGCSQRRTAMMAPMCASDSAVYQVDAIRRCKIRCSLYRCRLIF
jgi:hypothetical protein